MLFLSLFTTFGLLSACATHSISISRTDAAYGIEQRSETVQLDLQCPQRASVLDVDLDVCGVGGAARFSLRDPGGKVVWQVAARGGHVEQTGQLPAMAGRWRGELVLDGFSGDYSVGLSAHEWPELDVKVEITEVHVEGVEPGESDGAGERRGEAASER
jgi:hypothetical protein